MSKNKIIEVFLIISILALPFIYLASIYNILPATIPTHFNFKGEPDNYGDKSSLIFTSIILSAVSIGTYFLVKNAHKIDPKKAAGQSPELLAKIAWSLLIFLSIIQLIVIHSSIAKQIDGGKYIFPAVGLFLAVLGNFMHSIKPNYFIGFRIPWTLENEENWRKTHQLVSKVWVVGGLLIAISTLIINITISIWITLLIFILLVAIPTIYSYQLYKQSNIK